MSLNRLPAWIKGGKRTIGEAFLAYVLTSEMRLQHFLPR